jgi:hypothetical protein
MRRPKRKTASRKARVDFSEPEQQRGRHAPAPLFDLADPGAQNFDVRWFFEPVRYLFFSRLPELVQARALPQVTSLVR